MPLIFDEENNTSCSGSGSVDTAILIESGNLNSLGSQGGWYWIYYDKNSDTYYAQVSGRFTFNLTTATVVPTYTEQIKLPNHKVVALNLDNMSGYGMIITSLAHNSQYSSGSTLLPQISTWGFIGKNLGNATITGYARTAATITGGLQISVPYQAFYYVTKK